MILFIKDNNGCHIRFPVSPLFIDGYIDNVQKEVDSLKEKLQNKTKILNFFFLKNNVYALLMTDIKKINVLPEHRLIMYP